MRAWLWMSVLPVVRTSSTVRVATISTMTEPTRVSAASPAARRRGEDADALGAGRSSPGDGGWMASLSTLSALLHAFVEQAQKRVVRRHHVGALLLEQLLIGLQAAYEFVELRI